MPSIVSHAAVPLALGLGLGERRISRPLLMTNGTYDVLCPPDLAPSGLGARKMAELNEHIRLVEFPDIGHADLVECPQEAVRIVSEFFEQALVPA